MRYENAIRILGQELVDAWAHADAEGLRNKILPDAVVNFDVFPEGIDRDGLIEKLSQRPRKTDYVRFEPLNNIVVMGQEKAKQSMAMIGIYADPNDGVWSKYTFEGTFALEYVKDGGEWKFSSLKFMLTDENVVLWPRLLSDGIPQVKGPGDASFVANWVKPNHDDRIGWFPDRRLPAINPVYDAPWYGITDRVMPEHEEELIEEAFFRYAFGIDYNNFRLYEDAFTDDCRIIYGDTQPYTKRGVIEFLKAERQGSPRCTHTGFFTDVKIDGDRAIAKLYLRAPGFHPEKSITPESMDTRHSWARYVLRYKKENDLWKIDQLNFYMGLTMHEKE